MTTRLTVPLALLLLLATSASAQDRRRTELLERLRAQVERYRAGDLDRRAFMLRSLWQAGREEPRLVDLCRELAGESELFAGVAAARSDAFTAPAAPEPIDDLLARAAEGTSVAQAARYFRFLAAYDRLGADAQARLPDVPWVQRQRELASHDAALRELLPRLDALGLRDGPQLERVLVWTGGWMNSGGEYSLSRARGWLLPGATPARFEVLLGLESTTFVSTGELPEHLPSDLVDTAGGPLPRYEAVDYEAELVQWVATGGVTRDYRALDGLDRLDYSYFLAALFHARWAEQRGRHGLALRLVALSGELFAWERAGRGDPRTATLGDHVAQELALDGWHRAVVGLGRGEPRADLVTRLDLVVRAFPGNEFADRARALRDALAAQALDEAGHRLPTWVEWQPLQVEEKLRHLVFALRDLDGRQVSDPGECSVFIAAQVFPVGAPEGEGGAWGGSGRSVADAFAELGFAAVPTLIELLGDPRLTRSIGWHRSFSPASYHVLTYGDCVVQILERITGESFYARRSTNDPSRDDAVAEVKARARRWWQENAGSGEVDALVRGVLAADGAAPAKAQRLLELDRARGMATLVEALPRATGYTRRALLQLFTHGAALEHAEPLRREVREGPDHECRLIAAGALRRLGDDSWVAPFIDALAAGQDEATADLLLSLLRHGGPAGEAAAQGAFARLAGTARWRVLMGLMHSEPSGAVDVLLVGALDDETGTDSGLTVGTLQFGAMQADLAAYILAERLALDLRFTPQAPIATRRRWRLEIGNAWRRAHGQAERPLPPEPRPAPGGPNVVTRLRVEGEGWSARGLEVVRGLEGQALAATTLVDLAKAEVTSRPSGRVLFRLFRAVDGIELLARAEASSLAAGKAELGFSGRVGDETLEGGGVSTYRARLFEPDHAEYWDRQVKGLAKLLGAPAQAYGEASLRVEW